MTDRPYREIQIRNAALLITDEITKFVADQDRLETELEGLRVCKAELEEELSKERSARKKLEQELESERSAYATLDKAFASLVESFNRVTEQLEQLVDLQSRELSRRKAPATTIPAPPPTED